MKKLYNKNQVIMAGLLFLFLIGTSLAINDAHKNQDQPTRKNVFAQAIKEPTVFSIAVFLHGIGASGDNISPTNSRLSNKDPDSIQRNITVSVHSASGQLLLTRSGNVVYDENRGAYAGNVEIGNLPSSMYIIKIKSKSHLQKKTGPIRITSAQTANIPPVTLAAGDINEDNKIDIVDYNILRGCYSDLLPPTFCDDQRLFASDISDDGRVDAYDYNLFLREIGQIGD